MRRYVFTGEVGNFPDGREGRLIQNFPGIPVAVNRQEFVDHSDVAPLVEALQLIANAKDEVDAGPDEERMASAYRFIRIATYVLSTLDADGRGW